VPCPECGTYGESPDPLQSRWQCTQCGNGYFLRRCSACARVGYVDGLQGFHQPWPCTWCGRFNAGFSQNQDPAAASMAELAAEVARYGLARSTARPGADSQADPARVPDSKPVPDAPDPGDRPQATGPATTTGAGSPGGPPLGPTVPAQRPGRRRMRRIALATAAAVAACVAASLLLAAGNPKAAGMALRLAGQGDGVRGVQVTASRVGTVSLQGVAGTLSIVGTGTGQVTLTGQLHWAGTAPVVETRLDRAAGVLAVSVRCAPASPCTQNLRLTVPADTGTAVRQPAGQVVVTGLAGPLRIVAANTDISASGLRSPELAVVITSGHLDATFAAPPRQVTITLTSAQATLRLPARAVYRVTQEVTSGYVSDTIPQSDNATRTVTARINSGELELLPS